MTVENFSDLCPDFYDGRPLLMAPHQPLISTRHCPVFLAGDDLRESRVNCVCVHHWNHNCTEAVFALHQSGPKIVKSCWRHECHSVGIDSEWRAVVVLPTEEMQGEWGRGWAGVAHLSWTICSWLPFSWIFSAEETHCPLLIFEHASRHTGKTAAHSQGHRMES